MTPIYFNIYIYIYAFVDNILNDSKHTYTYKDELDDIP